MAPGRARSLALTTSGIAACTGQGHALRIERVPGATEWNGHVAAPEALLVIEQGEVSLGTF
jgi:hypothetical protein